MTLEELNKLSAYSGFELSADKRIEFLVELQKTIEILDKMKEWNDTENFSSNAKSLCDLRDDKSVETEFSIARDIGVPRVVREDD